MKLLILFAIIYIVISSIVLYFHLKRVKTEEEVATLPFPVIFLLMLIILPALVANVIDFIINKTSKYLFATLLVTAIIIIALLVSSRGNHAQKKETFLTDTIHLKEVPLKDTVLSELPLKDSILSEISLYPFKHKDIVFAQAKLESGNFTSNVFNKANNLFGMKQPYKRPFSAIGTYQNYLQYSSWQQSIEDRWIYESYYLHDKTRDSYFNYLSTTYAEDTNYVNKLISLLN